MGEIEDSLSLRRQAKRLTRLVGVNSNTLWIGYVMSIAMTLVFAYSGWVEDSYSRSGALIIFLATALSGAHFFLHLKVSSFFDENDFAYGAWGVSKPSKHSKQYETKEKLVAGQTKFLLRKCNEISRKKLTRSLNLVVVWETMI